VTARLLLVELLLAVRTHAGPLYLMSPKIARFDLTPTTNPIHTLLRSDLCLPTKLAMRSPRNEHPSQQSTQISKNFAARS
jgi:hypothetical protein